MSGEQQYTTENINNQTDFDSHLILKGQQLNSNLRDDEIDSSPFVGSEQIAAAADGGSNEIINFYENEQEYENGEEKGINQLKENESKPQQIQNEIKLEEQEDESEEEFHSFTLERDVDPDELKDPDNYYEQLSMSFYNTHKKGDQITRRMIEQSLQAYLETKRIENQRCAQQNQQIHRAGGSSRNSDEIQQKNVKVRVKVIRNNNINNNNNTNNNNNNIHDSQQNKRGVLIFQQNKNSSHQDLDKNEITLSSCQKKITSQRSQNIERQNEIPRILHHNQFQTTNAIKPHRYYIKENNEGEQSNNQKPINIAQLMQSNQHLGFQLNHSEYSKYTPNSKQVVDMDTGFRGSARFLKINNSNQNEQEPQQNLRHRLSFTNKGINLLNHIPSKVNLKNSAAPTINADDHYNDQLNINKVYTENNTPRNQKYQISSRKNSGGQAVQPSKFNIGSQRNLIGQQQKEVFPAIKLEEEHVRYINTNESLQIQGKNQIKLIKQNDFFEFAAQLYNTNKGGNPQNIPVQMMKKLAQNDQAFSTNQLQKISNQLQQKSNSNNQRQPIPFSNQKKELIPITSR